MAETLLRDSKGRSLFLVVAEWTTRCCRITYVSFWEVFILHAIDRKDARKQAGWHFKAKEARSKTEYEHPDRIKVFKIDYLDTLEKPIFMPCKKSEFFTHFFKPKDKFEEVCPDCKKQELVKT